MSIAGKNLFGDTPAPRAEADAAKIYAAYPRKRNALDAIKAIESVLRSKKTTAAELLAKVQQFAKSPAGRKGQFVPYCGHWMRAGAYLDDSKEWGLKPAPTAAQPLPPDEAARAEFVRVFDRARADNVLPYELLPNTFAARELHRPLAALASLTALTMEDCRALCVRLAELTATYVAARKRARAEEAQAKHLRALQAGTETR